MKKGKFVKNHNVYTMYNHYTALYSNLNMSKVFLYPIFNEQLHLYSETPLTADLARKCCVKIIYTHDTCKNGIKEM